MRIKEIQIRSWRHFENLSISLEDSVPLVCIVGANGTGKSHLLELMAACAHKLGLSQGIDIPRGDPFSDPHDFSVTFLFVQGIQVLDEFLADEPQLSSWDRTITITSKRQENAHHETIRAGGLTTVNEQDRFARRVIDRLRNSQAVHFLSLDADRSYPKRSFNIHEVAQAYEIDWSTSEYTRGRSFRPTTNLYDEWIKYFLAKENQAGSKLMEGIRRAREAGAADPTFTDHFKPYKVSLKQVLPHVVFVGVDLKERTLRFDTTGLELSFNQLSGGEREIAFLVGQIDRFQLKQGLFLLDEPELHLNADLIRVWVGYLTGTVDTGQVWLATHSLEAVEAAGQHATFVLERNDTTKKVDRISRLDARPALSALSRAVGTPAFSLSKLRFIFVEGEDGIGERERFRKLAGMPSDVRFMECGSCNEVGRRVAAVRALSTNAESGIRVGGIVDRDYRSTKDIDAMSKDGVFVLPVHEIENLFLSPPVVQALASQNGNAGLIAADVIRTAADARAGSWIFQYVFATPNAAELPEVSVVTKTLAKDLKWADFDGAARSATIERIANSSGYDDGAKQKLAKLLEIAAAAFEKRRAEDGLWKQCEGKQVLASVASAIGFSHPRVMCEACYVLWNSRPDTVPVELTEFRNYINQL